jgi:hypothetical protein
MKRIIITLSIFIVTLLATCILKTKIEGLCGNYTLTYAKVKDIFRHSDISGISDAYNMHYNRDLSLDC